MDKALHNLKHTSGGSVGAGGGVWHDNSNGVDILEHYEVSLKLADTQLIAKHSSVVATAFSSSLHMVRFFAFGMHAPQSVYIQLY